MTKWIFADVNHTVIRHAEDGSQFEWHRHEHPSNIAGHAAERWRSEGCPWPLPYKAAEPAPKAKPVSPDDYARSRRRDAGEPERNRRA
jgi:hypothetical protein